MPEDSVKLTKDITCPFCNFEFANSWAHDPSDKMQCPNCFGKFSFRRLIEVSYLSTKIRAGYDAVQDSLRELIQQKEEEIKSAKKRLEEILRGENNANQTET